MKKTLITLAALAMASVAMAATNETTEKHVALENITSTTGFFDNDSALAGDSGWLNRTQGNPAAGYTFSFTVQSFDSSDMLVAAYWNSSYSGDGAHAFVIDSTTKTLSVGLGSIKSSTGGDMLTTCDTWTWSSAFGSDEARFATFKNDDGFVALTKGTTYTVSLTDNTAGAQVATLTWEGGSATAAYNGNMNGGSWIYGGANTQVVPEPATATLSLLALAGLAARRRRK